MRLHVFDDVALTDATATDSDKFQLKAASGNPAIIRVAIGCLASSGSGDNFVTIRMYEASDWESLTDPADARWYEVPPEIFEPVNVLVGNNYSVDELETGDEYVAIRKVYGSFETVKLVAQRNQVSGGGTNAVTVDAWVTHF